MVHQTGGQQRGQLCGEISAALFLTAAIKLMARRSWAMTLTVSLGSLVIIWLVFRLVFTVLLPSGILPEAELVQALRDLFSGGN